MGQGERAARVAEQLQREAARILLEKADDPLLRSVTVTGVRLSADLRHAQILFTGSLERRAEIERRAQRFRPQLQRELARRLRLRYAVEIVLRYDEGFESAMRVEKILGEIGVHPVEEDTDVPADPRPDGRAAAPEDDMTHDDGPRDVSEREAARMLGDARRLLLGIHRNPDGDAVGSALGLAHVLRTRGAEVDCFFADGVPEPLRFLAGADRTLDRLPDGPPYDLAVALDCGDLAVLPRTWPGPDRYRGLLVIDHHAVRRPFGDWTCRDVHAACVGEIVVRIADLLGHTLDRPLAEAAYVSLVMDTGFFRYPSVTPEAFRLAARLLEAGVAPWKIAYLADENYPPAKLPMLVEILGSLRLEAGGAVATLTVPPGLLDRLGLGGEYLENVINFARGIRGVEIAAQLRLNDEGKVRVSLRSRGRADVAALARRHGGGGHHNAAGCTLEPPLETARERIVADATLAVRALPPLDPGDDGFFSR